jgi:transcriptional antiterminator
MTVDKNSLDYARFVIHIRFAIERLINNIPIKNVLLKTIKERYKKSYKLAQKVCKFIESELDVAVSEDEVGYIAVYIEELKNATRS